MGGQSRQQQGPKRKPGRPKAQKTGLTFAEFARRDGCSAAYVGVAVSQGLLEAYPDKSIDPKFVGTPWRAANRRKLEKEAEAELEKELLAANPGELGGDSLPGRMSRTEAELANITYKALAARREHDEAIGKVVLVSAVRKRVGAAYAKVRTKLLALPAEIAPQLAITSTAPEVQEILQRVITKALQALVDE